jgi:hypothetical protein
MSERFVIEFPSSGRYVWVVRYIHRSYGELFQVFDSIEAATSFVSKFVYGGSLTFSKTVRTLAFNLDHPRRRVLKK